MPSPSTARFSILSAWCSSMSPRPICGNECLGYGDQEQKQKVFRSAALQFVFFADCFHQCAHLESRTDRNANEFGSNLTASFTQQNALVLQLSEESRAPRTEIREQKIAGAGKGLHTEPAEFAPQPLPKTLYLRDITPHRSAVTNGGFRRHQRGDIDRKRWHGATQIIQGIRARDHCAEA